MVGRDRHRITPFFTKPSSKMPVIDRLQNVAVDRAGLNSRLRLTTSRCKIQGRSLNRCQGDHSW